MSLNRILTRLTRIPGARALWCRFPIGSVELRVQHGIFSRPQYAYGVYSAADLAKKLGITAITVVELGVAGGRGLLALQEIAEIVESHFGVSIHVAGFDSGQGMPPPTDYRDLPHVWNAGFYKMDPIKLKALLSRRTELILGDVPEMVSSWTSEAPIGFVAFDLDYYSSTKGALRLFERCACLPRTYCYFDDVIWPETACHNEYVGELCAIREFNQEHEYRKICPLHMLRAMRASPSPWNDQIYVCHDFKHPLYCKNLTSTGNRYTEMPL